MATGLLSTLVSVVSDSNVDLLAASSADRAVDVTEGSAITASVKLTRRPDDVVRVSFVSSGPLELGADGDPLGVGGSAKGIAPPTLVFTSSNWNVAQTIPIRSIQDNVADGTRTLPVRMSIAAIGKATATKAIWINSRDSGVENFVAPEPGNYSGTLDCPSDAAPRPASTGTVMATYDGQSRRGTATFHVSSARLANVRNRVIAVDYTVGPGNKFIVEAVRGFDPRGVNVDLAFQSATSKSVYGFSGVLTLTQPTLGRTETFTVTATLDLTIDINQYAGKWYEQGSVKRPSTARLVNTTFVFTPRPGSVDVVNAGRVGSPSGAEWEVVGSAIPVDSSNARLSVSFSGSNTADPPGNYWIRDIAPDYSWAIVSDSLGRNGAILTRQRHVEPAFYQALVRRAAFLGVSTGAITRTWQSWETS